MPNMIAMSFEGLLAPSFDLTCVREGRHPDGWGLGFYPGKEPAVAIIKEHNPRPGGLKGELIKAWEHMASSTFLLHIRRAHWGSISDANTQPFARSWGGRDWLFAHAGSLETVPDLPETSHFTPVGATDTEAVFCLLLDRIAGRGWRSLGEVDLDVMLEWLREIDALGPFSVFLSDGLDLLAYADGQAQAPVYMWERTPPYNGRIFGDADLRVDLFKRGIKSKKGVILSTEPLEQEEAPANWQTLTPGELVIIRRGTVRARTGDTQDMGELRPSIHPPAPRRAENRRFAVRHTTVYEYETAVERSEHLLRLTPIEDSLQRVTQHSLTISVDGRRHAFEDVFGNRCHRLLVETPFTEMRIESTSVVDVLDRDPFFNRPLRARTDFPLVWMPWQRQILAPFLLPPELPETQLRSLTEYAKGFVERNDADLVETLIDINWTIFKEYEYRQGSTTLGTTPFDVYVNRRGVCQDFANLFICLARLLGLPARYVCGYIYTGPKNPNQVQSEASHAWVQLYLPDLGWKGFDPTNGLITQTDHVRVAYGRNYMDATPTSGTLFVGGGPETLTVEVSVEPIDDADGPPVIQPPG